LRGCEKEQEAQLPQADRTSAFVVDLTRPCSNYASNQFDRRAKFGCFSYCVRACRRSQKCAGRGHRLLERAGRGWRHKITLLPICVTLPNFIARLNRLGIRRSPKKLKHWSPATLVQGRGSPSKTRYSPQVFVSDFVAVGQAVSAYRHVGSQFFFFGGGEVWGPALLGWAWLTRDTRSCPHHIKFRQTVWASVEVPENFLGRWEPAFLVCGRGLLLEICFSAPILPR